MERENTTTCCQMVKATSDPRTQQRWSFIAFQYLPLNSLEESSIYLVWRPEVPAVMGLTKADPLPLPRSWTYRDKDDEKNLQKTLATIQQ